MPYAIITEDKPDMLATRLSVRDVHLDYLIENQHLLLAAGALLEDDGSGGSGGILLVDVDTRAEAEAFIADDPFTKAGLFAQVTITRWRKSFLDGNKYI